MDNLKLKLLGLNNKKQLTTEFIEGTTPLYPDSAYTMIGLKRLNNIEDCINIINRDNIKGDFIETGVWRGGGCIFMNALNKKYKLNRKIYVADSFEGLPKATHENDCKDSWSVNAHNIIELKISKDIVEQNFKDFNLLDDNVVFVEGFFNESLKNAPIESLSLLRLDGDMYSSTMDALIALYDKVVPNGFIIVDDYHDNLLQGCKQAIHDFIKIKKIKDIDLKRIGVWGAYWQK
jgi:O-methyltransferase